MRHRRRPVSCSLVAGLLTAAALTVADASPASAHEQRTVGRYQFVVGWGEEPAYTGLRNSVYVRLSEANGGPPVTGLRDSLKVELIKGSERKVLALEPNFGVGSSAPPGEYRASVIPTRPGSYSFRFTGDIRGQVVDETFTSSQTTFDEVEDLGAIQFPARDPSGGELATRLEREVRRLDNKADDLDGQVRSVTVAALVAVALALVAAAVAVGARRRRGAAVEDATRPGDALSRDPIGQAGSSTR